MPLRINPQGDIERDDSGPPIPAGSPLEVAMREPGGRITAGARQPALDVGFGARKLLDRAVDALPGDRLAGGVVVAPAVLDLAHEDPTGASAHFVEDAVSTLIASAMGAQWGDGWSPDHSRLAFATAFGVDPRSADLRGQLLHGGRLPDVAVEPGLVPVIDGDLPVPVEGPGGFRGLPDGVDPGDLRPFDDLLDRTCVLGVFQALHQLGRALADAPREYAAAHIDELDPDHGCAGDRITIRGTGFGAVQPAGVVLVFPLLAGGWVGVDVDPRDWTDTVITATAPTGVGTGPVGFVSFGSGTATPVGPAVDDFVGEVGACFGAGAQLRAIDVFGNLGPVGKVSITPTATNRFRGGPPKIDYFLANGALHALIRPGGPLQLQWSAINADSVVIRPVGTAPPQLPAIPPGDQPPHGELLFASVAGGTWTGSYELVAANGCGQVTQSVEIEMRTRKALALAGGGAKGSFEVGAARCLYDVFGYRPDLVTGASVGALNAAKLAEGPAALPQLEQLWKDMTGPQDLFFVRAQINTILTQMGPDIRNMLNLTPLEDLLGWSPAPVNLDILNLNIAARAASWANSGVGSAAGVGTIFTVSDILFSGIGLGLTIGKIVTAIQQLLLQPSLLLFDPVRDKIDTKVSPTAVRNSGVRLRIVVNGLRTGKVRYVDENGAFVDGGPAPGLANTLAASASIPIAYPPVRLPDGEDYVDGGVLENAPIEAAVRAGADEVIAVLPSPAALASPSTAPTTLLPITARSLDLLLDGSSRRQVEPFRGWGVPVTVIAPRFEIYNLLAVDPGLIRINMDYGYMRAYDEMQTDDNLRPAYRASSDAIASLRKTVWYQEHWQNAQYPKGFVRTGQIQPTGSADQVLWTRDRKREIRDLVVARVRLTGVSVNESVPAMIDEAWTQWEGHFFDTLIPTPWDGWSSYPGAVLQPETPPPPLP